MVCGRAVVHAERVAASSSVSEGRRASSPRPCAIATRGVARVGAFADDREQGLSPSLRHPTRVSIPQTSRRQVAEHPSRGRLHRRIARRRRSSVTTAVDGEYRHGVVIVADPVQMPTIRAHRHRRRATQPVDAEAAVALRLDEVSGSSWRRAEASIPCVVLARQIRYRPSGPPPRPKAPSRPLIAP